MSDKYKELRELAERATPGPWKYGAYGGFYESGDNGRGIGHCQFKDGPMRDNGRLNEQYIAAANPATITELLRERDAYLKALKEIAASPWEPDAGGAISLAQKAHATIESAKRQEG